MLAELDRRGAIAFLHPTSCAGHEALALGYPRPMIEFLFDTARTIVDFVLSGAARRFPDLRVIVPHMGGVLPLLADRVELINGVTGTDTGDVSVFESLRRLYYDLAGAPNATQLAALRSIAAPERLLYGSDYAWTPRDVVLGTLGQLDELEPADWRTQTTHNARTLLTS